MSHLTLCRTLTESAHHHMCIHSTSGKNDLNIGIEIQSPAVETQSKSIRMDKIQT